MPDLAEALARVARRGGSIADLLRADLAETLDAPLPATTFTPEAEARYRDDPRAFVLEVLRPSWWTDAHGRPRQLRAWQEAGYEAIRARLAAGQRRLKVHVRACWGAGKDWWLASLALWYVRTRRDARGLTMAQSWAGVEDLLWPEIADAFNRSTLRGAPDLKLNATELVIGNEDDAGKPVWYVTGGSSDRASRLEGHHSRTAAFRAVDEASGVDDEFFDRTEGMLDAPEILDVWISTPGLRSGRFYERDVSDDGDDVLRIVVTCDDLVADGVPGKEEWKRDMQVLRRRDAQLYASRVDAQYMEQLEGSLYPYAWIERAMHHTWTVPGPAVVATDVAGSVDGDENAVYARTGPDAEGRYELRFLGAWHERDTMITKGRCLEHLRQLEDVSTWRIDANGIGKGLADQAGHEVELQERGVEIEHYRSSDPSSEILPKRNERGHRPRRRFANRKAEDGWHLRDLLEAGLVRLPNVQALKGQLAQIRDELSATGAHRLVDPPDSPDHVDAVLMTLSDPVDPWLSMAGQREREREQEAEGRVQ